MGREVRKVPPDWEHPKGATGYDKPLHDGLNKDIAEFEQLQKEKGTRYALDWFGGGPNPDDYMPDWPEEERTHLQMYEDCSEGTPISPVMETPEELARWLADNKASAFGRDTATYEQWLATIKAGWAPSAMFAPGKGLISGVAATKDFDDA